MKYPDIGYATLDWSQKDSEESQKKGESVELFHKHFNFSGLVITTLVSLLLLASDKEQLFCFG